MQRFLFIAAYDIREPRRLAKVLAVIKGYASGGQKSAYECWITLRERQQMTREVAEVMDQTEDSFALIPLHIRKPVAALGAAVEPADPDFYYFG